MKDFKLLPHTADIKVRVFGKTLPEFFRNAVVAMFQSIGPSVPDCCVENERIVCDELPIARELEITSSDRVALLVDFLSEALYLSDVYDEAYFDAIIKEVTDTHIKATLQGVKITGFEVVEIKAVTYHGLDIKQVNGSWQADIVFDI
ncbi:MAG: archease [bacterium]|nr:archease [bacterium]